MEGPEVGRGRDVAARGGREGEYRDPLLPQQPAGRRALVRPGGAGPLVGGERVPLALDVTFREDDSRIRERVPGSNIAWLYGSRCRSSSSIPTGG